MSRDNASSRNGRRKVRRRAADHAKKARGIATRSRIGTASEEEEEDTEGCPDRDQGKSRDNGSEEGEDEDDDEDEDVQVFQCVCNNVRAERRVRRKRDGTFIVIPDKRKAAAVAAAPPWPDEAQTSECPRCGVWGHTACLEYVVPMQFAIPEGNGYAPRGGVVVPVSTELVAVAVAGQGKAVGEMSTTTKAVKRNHATRLGCGEGPARNRGRGAGQGSEEGPPGSEGLDGGAGSAADGDAAGADVFAAPADVSSNVAARNLSDDGDRGENDAASERASHADAAVFVSSPLPPPPRPICWMCMQEKAEAADATEAATGGGAPATAPRRPGKVSGGGSSGGGGGGGGGGAGGTGGTPAPFSAGRRTKRGRTAAGVVVGTDDTEGAHDEGGVVVRNSPGKARSPKAAGSHGDMVGDTDGRRGSTGARAIAWKATTTPTPVAECPVVTQKRARVGPKLLGKEVRVSDGVAVVLTGVVSAIEDGQARVHYKGRKAKLDEWIDVRSERFLSAAEVCQSLSFLSPVYL